MSDSLISFSACTEVCLLFTIVNQHRVPVGFPIMFLSECKTIFLCARVNAREVILTWRTGCSTVCVKPGSLPPNTTWLTSKSSYQSSSTCPSSCSTPTTLTWVSKGSQRQRPEMSIFYLCLIFPVSVSQVPNRMALSWLTSSCHLGQRETHGSLSGSTER